uniref:hypothetical protein n=1 Tax=Klebsiella pneumoniae TaxID=573 RepID=UPI0015EF3941
MEEPGSKKLQNSDQLAVVTNNIYHNEDPRLLAEAGASPVNASTHGSRRLPACGHSRRTSMALSAEKSETL